MQHKSIIENQNPDEIKAISSYLPYPALVNLGQASKTMHQLVGQTSVAILVNKTNALEAMNQMNLGNGLIRFADSFAYTAAKYFTRSAMVGVGLNTLANLLPASPLTVTWIVGGCASCYVLASPTWDEEYDDGKHGLRFGRIFTEYLSKISGLSAGFALGLLTEQAAPIGEAILAIEYVRHTLTTHSIFTQQERQQNIDKIRNFVRENPVNEEDVQLLSELRV